MFMTFLFIVTLITGLLWMYDYFWAAPFRAKEQKIKDRLSGEKKQDPLWGEKKQDPLWVEWGAHFFPVLLAIFLIRSFVVEPFRIPSTSMLPTLQVGDFILVKKFAYGLRFPIGNRLIFSGGLPQYGDVIVFFYPQDGTTNYIKRVVGLPGDHLVYNQKNKELFLNDKKINVSSVGEPFFDDKTLSYMTHYQESFREGESHTVAYSNDHTPLFLGNMYFPYRKDCVYSVEHVDCYIPQHHYFVMGDNRDNSSDSRAWGFVPEDLIVGKAFLIWFHSEKLFPPTELNWSRIGLFF